MNATQKRTVLASLANVTGIFTGRTLIEPWLPGLEPIKGARRGYARNLEEIFGTPDFPNGRGAIMPPGTYGGEPI